VRHTTRCELPNHGAITGDQPRKLLLNVVLQSYATDGLGIAFSQYYASRLSAVRNDPTRSKTFL